LRRSIALHKEHYLIPLHGPAKQQVSYFFVFIEFRVPPVPGPYTWAKVRAKAASVIRRVEAALFHLFF
jgi:hypothetical protein